jgi:hypothetical protein
LFKLILKIENNLKMLFIAHRGNTNGPNKELENSPAYINSALDKGYYVEVDVRKIDSTTVGLGHDKAEYFIPVDFLKNPLIICHAKTPETLEFCLDNNLHVFSHDQDDCVLTSRNYIWTYPGKELGKRSIYVMPEWIEPDPKSWLEKKCAGICTDWIEKLI